MQSKTYAKTVIKRNGNEVPVAFDKITRRIKGLSNGLAVEPSFVTQEVIKSMVDRMNVSEIDELAAQEAAFMVRTHVDYLTLAGRLIVSNLHKLTPSCFSEAMEIVNAQSMKYDPSSTGDGFLSAQFMARVRKHSKALDAAINHNADYMYDYFGIQTLLNGYLNKIHDKETNMDRVIERPQYMLMRVALFLNMDDVPTALQTYKMFSEKLYTHASPTLFNAGKPEAQMSSCFVAGTLIHTDRGPVPIENVKIGDNVITHKGNWKKVLQLHTNALNGRTLYNLKCDFTDIIRVTGNHRFWCVTPDNMEPRWVRVDQMPEVTYIALPNKVETSPHMSKIDLYDLIQQIKFNSDYDFTFESDIIKISTVYSQVSGLPSLKGRTLKKHKRCNDIKRVWNVDNDFAKFVGIWLGDGHIMKSTTAKNVRIIRGIGITLDHRNILMKDFLDKVIPKIFGIEPCYHRAKSQNVLQILINSPIIGEVFNHLFGQGFAGKHLHPMMYHWPSELIRQLLIGMMSSDGCMTKDGKFLLGFSNRQLCEQTYFLVRSVGEVMNFTKKNGTRKLATCPYYHINPPQTWFHRSELLKYYGDGRNVQEEQDFITAPSSIKSGRGFNIFSSIIRVADTTFVKVQKERNTIQDQIPDYVYTLGVEDDHSYCAGGLMAENCFLLRIPFDSLDSIYDTLKQCAMISKHAGGIGLAVHGIRATGARIKSSGGLGDGLVPMLRVYNNTARYVNQGGKRKGAFAIYLEPWHADIKAFIELKKNRGNEEERARDLHYAMWIPDLFMRRVENDEDWSLFSPDTALGLNEVYGENFEALYNKYEQSGVAFKVVKAREIWEAILESQVETGEPYILYKDACNEKSNQKNLGTIQSSNLCAEILEYTSADEVAVCMTGDTLILTEEGLIRLDQCHGKRIMVPFNDDIHMEPRQRYVESILLDRGIKQTFKIITVSGNSIQSTADHKFLKVVLGQHTRDTKFEWTTLSNLKEGDMIYSPNKIDPLPGYDIDISKAYIPDYGAAGWLLGDGWQLHNTYGVCFGPTETHASTQVLMTINKWHDDAPVEFMGRKRKVSTYTQPNGVINWSSQKKGFIEYVQDRFGMLPHKGPSKEIPEKIMKSSPTQIASFLTGLFSADGTVMKDKTPVVSLASASHTLLKQTQLLLQCFGIVGRIIWNEVKSRQRFQGRIDIRGQRHLSLFKKFIGFELCPPKQLKLETHLQIFEWKQTHKGRCFTTISKIEKSTMEHVYDLALSEGHHYIANGIVTHNCNLSSICLPSFLEDGKFNYQKLYDVTYTATQNLNRVIDLNYYPIKEAKTSNMRHRPIGIGVQGLADVFCMMMLPFESEEARQINRDIFETIYFAAVTASKDLSKQFGPYESYPGSPASQGLLQFDLWDIKPSSRWNWDGLKKEISQYGMRNSLLVALMPTASTAQIMGNNEGCEAYTRNLYVRRTDAGEFIVVNKHLATILSAKGLWNRDIIDQMIANDGSIQSIQEIPEHIRKVFKTTYEVKSKPIIDMSADRGPYICQTQSMNLWVEKPTPQLLNTIHFYGWKKGLKTGMYYLRSKALTGAQKFVLDPSKVEKAQQSPQPQEPKEPQPPQEEKKKGKVYQKEGKTYVCTDDVCVSCGS